MTDKDHRPDPEPEKPARPGGETGDAAGEPQDDLDPRVLQLRETMDELSKALVARNKKEKDI